MSGPTLLELGKAWLPDLYEYDHTRADCTFYSMTIKPGIVGRVWKGPDIINPGKKGFLWDASFNIRYGNTTIHLHSDPEDRQLKRFRKKLVALRNGIRTFIHESKRRIAKPADAECIFKREWLNELTAHTPYTGYFFYEIQPNGGGKFFIADCSRSINLWIDYYGHHPDEVTKGVEMDYLERKWKWLDEVATHLDAAVDSIKILNGRHRNGELVSKLPKDSDKVVITRF
jgi:hypothetical protein